MEPKEKFKSISWQADEYPNNPKTWSWVLVFAITAGAIIFLVGAVTDEILPTASVALLIALYGIYVIRQPKKQDFQLTETGIKAGEFFYPFSKFRSFSVLEDRPKKTLFFPAHRRFVLPLMIEMPDEQAKIIAEQLSKILPHSSVKPDPIERFIAYLRF